MFIFILTIISTFVFAADLLLLYKTAKLLDEEISRMDCFKISIIFIFLILVPFMNIILSILFLYMFYNDYKNLNKDIAEQIMKKLTEVN